MDRTKRTGDVTRVLARLHAGDHDAVEALLPLVYEELRDLAARVFRGQRGHTLQPTALVNEAYLKLAGHDGTGWNDRAHFLAVAATAMRQVLLNHARDRRAEKRGGDDVRRVTLDRVLATLEEENVSFLDLDDAITRLSAVSERQARLVELRVFGGLTLEESARVLSITLKRVRIDWQFAKAWLKRELRTAPD